MLGYRWVSDSSSLARRLTAVVSALGIASGLVLVDAAVARPQAGAEAEAREFCSDPDEAATAARNHNRFSRVRTKACLEFRGAEVIARGVGQTDKPSGCQAGFPPSCDATVGAGRAEYRWVEITVKANGKLYEPCRWDDEGAHDRTWTCHTAPAPNPGGAQEFVAEAQTCFDMKDDGADAKCTRWAELRHAG